MQISEILRTKILGNSLEGYLFAVLIFFVSIFALEIAKKILFHRLGAQVEKTRPTLDGFLVELLKKMLLPVLYVGAFYFAVKQLTLNEAIDKLVSALGVIVLTLQTIRLLLALLLYVLERTWFRKEAAAGGTPVSKSILTIVRVVVWGLGIVFVLDNLGFNVSAVVAGLGIGGVAAALAAQTILGDLFNYFVIFFDRPFEEGDFVIFEDSMGVIENIGIKSTRLRSLDGEQIVVSNSNLTASKIRNYKRMQRRRVVFQLGVVYETPLEKMREIPTLLRSIIEGFQKTKFDRAHFKAYGDFSLNFEVVYYVLTSEYNLYMDIHQEINLKIKEAFEKEGIEFAYPTQVELQKRLP